MSLPNQETPHNCRMLIASMHSGGDMDTNPAPYPLHNYYFLDNLYINSVTAERIREAHKTSQDALQQTMEELMTEDKIYLLRGLFITLSQEDTACYLQCIEILKKKVFDDPHGIPAEGILALSMFDCKLDPETQKFGEHNPETMSTCIELLKDRKEFDILSTIRRCSIEQEIRRRVSAVLEESLEDLGEVAAVVVGQWGSNVDVRKRAVGKLRSAAGLDYIAYHQSHPSYKDELVERYARELLEKLTSDNPNGPSLRHIATLKKNAAAARMATEVKRDSR